MPRVQKDAKGNEGAVLVSQSKASADMIRLIARHGLRAFVQSTRTLIAWLDPQGALLACNSAWEALGPSLPETKNLAEVAIPADKPASQRLLLEARRQGTPARGQLNLGASDRSLPCECLIIPLDGGEFLIFGEPIQPSSAGGDETQRLQAELARAKAALAIKEVELQAVLTQAHEVSHTDALTFLPNRRMLVAEFQREVRRSERYNAPLTVSLLDLDKFKQVNDTYGHAAGDNVLILVARELRGHIREPDVIGRYGGDEFMVILPNSSTAAAAEQASRLCQRIRSTPASLGGKAIVLTLSVGIAQLKIGLENWQALLERADRALYEAKDAGGNGWRISSA
jgi:diguanylate cyclase (GGDEF)-like protein